MEHEIEVTILEFLKTQEGEGVHTGGSGHLSNIHVKLLDFEIEEASSQSSYSYVGKIRYVRSTETEFTYYPDNPPVEDIYSQLIYLDDKYVITGFTQKELISSNVDIDQFLIKDDKDDKIGENFSDEN